jgi:C1A family cysteine protease
MMGESIFNDSGLYVRDAAKCISKYGACQETAWPYNTNNFSQLPPLSTFQVSKMFNNFIYTTVSQDLNSLKTCLTTKQVPIIFGFVVYSSFMTTAVARTGIVPMPNTSREAIAGGHCTNIVGYDDSKQWFICANSWGTGWGDKGYFYMPYAYITNSRLASDFTYLYF